MIDRENLRKQFGKRLKKLARVKKQIRKFSVPLS